MKLDGESVIDIARLPELQPITLKMLYWEGRDERLVIKECITA